MNKSRRLKPVVDHAQRNEQEAARRLGEGNRYLQQQIKRLGDLQHYRLEYYQGFQERGRQGMSVTQMREFQRFMAQLDTAIEKQNEVIANARQRVEALRQVWFQKRNKKKMLDTVVDKYRLEEVRADERLEQRQNDEVAQRYHRNGGQDGKS